MGAEIDPPRAVADGEGGHKADAKAERAEMLAHLHRGERVERSSRAVGEVAEA